MPSKRQCVIKQFFNQSGLKAQKAKELFVQEAVQLETLGKQHPQIPELFAHLELGIGLFLVQEFIDGQDLLQELKQEGAFDEVKIRQLLNDLLRVLQFIHNQQVIHRDIKPENIIRRQIDSKPVLVDFGVSKFATETALERTGTVIGSRGYAAPEQSEGKVYFSSDLFSLGRTCFHLLTDTHPSKVFAPYGNWEKYLRNHLNKISISDALKRVLTRLLQPDISQRYQSTDEVVQDLNSDSIEATTESPKVFPTSVREPDTHTWRRVNVFGDYPDQVTSIAISPDGKILASGSRDKAIKLWHLDSGELIYTLSGHLDRVSSVAISPDGKILASGSLDKTINLWDLLGGKLIHTLSGHLDRVSSVAISPDGKILASGSWDKTINLWDLGSGKLIHTLSGHLDRVSSVAISPDGKILASGSWDKTIKLWHLGSGKVIDTLSEHYDSVLCIAISPDGKTLASCSQDTTINLWGLDSGKLLHTLTQYSNYFTCVAFTPNGKILASSSRETIKLWHLGNCKLMDTFTGSIDFTCVTISQKGDTLATGSLYGTITIWQRD